MGGMQAPAGPLKEQQGRVIFAWLVLLDTCRKETEEVIPLKPQWSEDEGPGMPGFGLAC